MVEDNGNPRGPPWRRCGRAREALADTQRARTPVPAGTHGDVPAGPPKRDAPCVPRERHLHYAVIVSSAARHREGALVGVHVAFVEGDVTAASGVSCKLT